MSAKLDKLDNDVKKLNNYIKENNNKIINTENKLDNANNKYNNLLLEYNELNEKIIKIKDKLYEIKNGSNKSEDHKQIVELKKIKKEFNHKNTKMIEIKNELDKKKDDISNLNNIIKDLKNKNLLISKHEQEILDLKKQLDENEKYFNDEEKNRIKKDNEINRYKHKIQELKEKLNYKGDASKIKSNDIDMPYLETEEEAAERIADFHEKKEKGMLIYLFFYLI